MVAEEVAKKINILTRRTIMVRLIAQVSRGGGGGGVGASFDEREREEI
mgnify:CR=1 FL=1